MVEKDTKEKDDLVLFEKKLQMVFKYSIFISLFISILLLSLYFFIELAGIFYGDLGQIFGTFIALYILLIIFLFVRIMMQRSSLIKKDRDKEESKK